MLVKMHIKFGNIGFIPSIEDNWPREEVNALPESPDQRILLLTRSPERQFLHIRLLGVARPDANPSGSFHVNVRRFLLFAVRAEFWGFCGYDSVRLARLRASIVCFLAEKEEEDNCTAEEDARPVEYPPPALVLGDKAADDRRKVVTSC